MLKGGQQGELNSAVRYGWPFDVRGILICEFLLQNAFNKQNQASKVDVQKGTSRGLRIPVCSVIWPGPSRFWQPKNSAVPRTRRVPDCCAFSVSSVFGVTQNQ